MTDVAREAFLSALSDDDPIRLYDEAPCGFLSTTPDGIIVKVNATICRWLDARREDLVGASFTDLLTGGGRIYHETHYAPMLQMHDKVRELALELQHTSGRRLPVLVNATMVRDATGRPRGIRVAIFDASERRRYEQELLEEKRRAEASEARARGLVETLQRTLVPPSEPRVPGLELAATNRPAGGDLLIGGDFYDVFPLGGGEWGVVLGDVCGKDVEAAAVTALARWTVRGAAPGTPGTERVLELLNETLRQHETERFCTLVFARLRPAGRSWRLVVGVGGHPPPLLLSEGAVTPLPNGGPLVGVLREARFPEQHLELRPGDGLVLYTDGVTEARRGAAFFGEQRLHASVAARGTDPRTIVDGLLDDVATYEQGRNSDDVAILALRVPSV